MKKKYTNAELMGTAPVAGAVLRLSLPTLLGALIGLVYNLTDTFFIGLLKDYAQIASLSLAMPIPWLTGAVGNLLSAGAPAYISRKLGSGDREAVRRCGSFALYATLGLGALVTFLLLPLLGPALRLMGASEATFGYAHSYLTILVAFSVVNLVQGALQGLLRAVGDTRAASFGNILGIAVNIVLDPVMIFALDLGIRGAALATAAGYVVSGVYFYVRLRAAGDILSLRPADCRPNRTMVGDVISVGSASLLSTLIVCVPMALGNRLAAGYGDTVLAAVGIGGKVYSVVATVAAGFAMGLQPFIGYNHGANQRRRMLRGMLCSAAMGTGLCLVSELTFALFAERLVGLFSQEPEVVYFGGRMLRYFLIYIPFVSIESTMTTYLTATGRAMKTTWLTLTRQLIVFVPLALLLLRTMGPEGVMLAQPLSSLPALLLAALFTAAAMKKDLAGERLPAAKAVPA